jgi:hypothetical protein
MSTEPKISARIAARKALKGSDPIRDDYVWSNPPSKHIFEKSKFIF